MKPYTQSELIEIITPILADYPVKRSALFGSYARNEQNPDSDVDLLFDLGVNETYTSVDYIFDLLTAIESKISLYVDYITVQALQSNPSAQFIKNIESDSRWFYEV